MRVLGSEMTNLTVYRCHRALVALSIDRFASGGRGARNSVECADHNRRCRWNRIPCRDAVGSSSCWRAQPRCPGRGGWSNLSRLIGSRHSDIGRKREVIKRVLEQMNPSVRVAAFQESVLDMDVEALAWADAIMCCTDGHGSRALLTELSFKYMVRS